MCARITLTVVEGPHLGDVLACVGRTQITIGRSEECTFQLHGAYEDLLVSRRHCLIAVHPDRVEIRDLESRNGTYVNGQRLGFLLADQPDGSLAFKRRLKDGDAIRVGNSLLRIGVSEVAGDAVHLDGVEMLSRKLPDV